VAVCLGLNETTVVRALSCPAEIERWRVHGGCVLILQHLRADAERADRHRRPGVLRSCTLWDRWLRTALVDACLRPPGPAGQFGRSGTIGTAACPLSCAAYCASTPLSRSGPIAVWCRTLAPASSHAAVVKDAALETVAEQSKFVRTGRYDEVARRAPLRAGLARCCSVTQFGRTPRRGGRCSWLAARAAAFDSRGSAPTKSTLLLMQGGIHAGEIDGKAQASGLARAAERCSDPGALKSSCWFRAGLQRRRSRTLWSLEPAESTRPQEMGWRATAAEFQSQSRLHEAIRRKCSDAAPLGRLGSDSIRRPARDDGAEFQHDVSNTLEPYYAGRAAAATRRPRTDKTLERPRSPAGSKPLDFYPSFVVDDRSSSDSRRLRRAALSHGYWALHNASAVVGTHSWKDYPTPAANDP